MKTIALLPFKNEEVHLPSFLSTVNLCADMLVAVDDGSTDSSLNLVIKNCKIPFRVEAPMKERGEDWSVDKIRQQLLELGRREGGTHFICLDADECFTRPFYKKLPKILGVMEPGQKVQMQWLAMWKSVDHYREDHSVWSNNYKDFIFCDDGTSNFNTEAYFCDPRTPGENTEENTLKLNPKHGAVMHFQFSNWKKFQLKQCWYRCRERVFGKNVGAINQKFVITLDDPNAFVKACPSEWIPEHPLPKISLHETVDTNWHLKEIAKLFEEHGVNFFKELQIWHVPEIKQLESIYV